MYGNSNFNNFLVPSNQNFDDDNLEDELQAILNENNFQAKKSSNSRLNNDTNKNKISTNLMQDNLNNFNPNVYSQIDFNKLNLDDDVEIDETFDENDPDLNNQLAAIIGQEYQQNVAQTSNNKNLPKQVLKLNNNSSITNDNCLLLQNSHFFKQNEVETKKTSEKTVLHNDKIIIKENSEEKEFNKEKLEKLKEDYKQSALKAKKENDLENAKFYFKKYKELESCLDEIKSGKISNISEVKEKQFKPENFTKNEEENQLKNASPSPKNFLDDLEARKNKIQESYQKAVAENNGFKIRSFTRVLKQFDNAIQSYKTNKSFDYSSLPIPPGFDEISQNTAINSSNKDSKSSDLNKKSLIQNDSLIKNQATSNSKTILEELEKRKNKFNETLLKVKTTDDSSKMRLIEKILKQYEVAIQANKSGQKFDYSVLPIPPGFEEISQEIISLSDKNIKNNQESKMQVQNTTSDQIKNSDQTIKSKPAFKRALSINDKQLDYLLQRQKLFKEAAIESKKRNDITQAKEYLKKSKGFDPLIEAVKNGLPIDASSIPIPPQLEEDFVMVSDSIEATEVDLNQEELYEKLAKELNDQIDLCSKNKENFLKIGDVSTGSKFEKYLIEMKKDYEMLKSYRLRNEKVPKFRYENKIFSIVVCNTDLQINELSIQIIRGIDYPCKNPVDSYVKFEFPFPKDSPQFAKTHSFKNSLYPEYNQFFKFTIDRKSRSLARVFKKPLKCEIFSKGGFFKSDELIGHVNIPLSDLEKKCTIYDSFPLMNGRREIGGKLQVRIKIREPLFAKQIEEIKEKWLIFG